MLDFIVCALCSSIIVFFAYQWINIRLDFFRRRNIFHIKPTWNPVDWYRDLFNVSWISRYQNLYLQTEPHRYVGIYRDLFTPTLLLRDPDLIRTVLSKEFDSFSSRVKTFVTNKDSSGYFLTNLDGERWHQTRKGLSPVFTPIRQKFLLSLFEKPASELVAKLGDGLEESTDIYSLSTRYQLHIMAFCAYGIDADITRDEESLFYRMTRILLSPLKSYILRGLLSIIPATLRPYFRSRVINEEAESFFKQVLEDMIRHRRKVDDNTKQDFLEHFMKLMQRTDNAEGKHVEWSMETITAQCILFIIGGTFAPAALISWALQEIASAPAIQSKLYEEVRNSLEKSNGQITYENIQEMEYLNKVTQETLRKYPLASVILQRECVRTCHLSDTDVVVEKGTRIIIPMSGVHYDPKFYPKPEIFDPERFNDENKKNRHPYVFLPFGKGPRSCIAEKFSLFCLKYAIVRIMLNFELQSAPSSSEYFRLPLEKMIENVGKIKVIFKQRKV